MAERGARFPLLISYAYLRAHRAEVIEELLANELFDVFLDSGAFTAKNAGEEIKLAEYVGFLKEHAPRLFGYVALDKLQDPVETDRNLQTMLDAGLRPVPVHVFGDDEARMDYLFGVSDWVALGGLRRPKRGAAPIEYIQEKMKWARGRRVHWLGLTNQDLLLRFRPYSCDCSSWASGEMYGSAVLYFGKGRWSRVERTEARRRVLSASDHEVLARAGVRVADFFDNVRWGKRGNDEDLVPMNVSAWSWVRYILDMQRVHGVRVFLATQHSARQRVVVERFVRQETAACA